MPMWCWVCILDLQALSMSVQEDLVQRSGALGRFHAHAVLVCILELQALS